MLANPVLCVLGAWLTVWPFLAVRWAHRQDLAPGFTTGAGAGPALLLVALPAAAALLTGV
ncbi:hypothetical protein GCM10007079_11410 [Nocardiopsis terrae]|uniref:Uncharacterized protein n=1 Tax=Nocardiopsis terrae TaxID=372655 RepID=A0ABR9HC97_9ACTN|nr:hypothetical protein [Nocardiopsis terrae]MBE1456647.1 hypothetical protein [Nocardiopsis terrae]GHC75770.1 hypothetical protein GCM10007079_11410 [Nocardiopsis terrae]